MTGAVADARGIHPPVRLGTRASLLATTQSGTVAEAVRAATGRTVELVPITTAGDVLTGPLAQLGGTGVFVAALRDALLRGDCDIVVHSMKDLPTGPVDGLCIGAVPQRASMRDVLCTARPARLERDGAGSGLTLDDLPEGAVVGSGSPRRVAQLLRRRPDLVVRGIRGNVDTRLRKVDEGEYDAVVLAEAGLARIGRPDRIDDAFETDAWPTSAGQGALAVEVRSDDPFAPALAALTDADTEATALLERAVLRRLEAGCAAPVGISARVDPAGSVVLLAEVYAVDGVRSVRVERALARTDIGDDAGRDAAAADVVDELLAGGAADLADLPGSSR
ncbi:hydroxymethylbilane synthase [Microbacterium dextranolyticum]|uniref:hydroxymethylbilane synthase n=1 Tax=Microbacterium dextranolyticum TaxID=36806 RepID=UPI001DBD6A1A|nr:hydroxymethylbilane synthase [Microbacterium dextranolyticum]MBM7463417.1 hydroxymethylbilane synthase [Microbacterium dextranolyticum]